MRLSFRNAPHKLHDPSGDSQGENVCPHWVGSAPALHNPPWNPLPHPAPGSHCTRCRALTHLKVEPCGPYSPQCDGDAPAAASEPPLSSPLSLIVILQTTWREEIPVRTSRYQAERIKGKDATLSG